MVELNNVGYESINIAACKRVLNIENLITIRNGFYFLKHWQKMHISDNTFHLKIILKLLIENILKLLRNRVITKTNLDHQIAKIT